MNDYWNDPPEEPGYPPCPACPDGYGDYLAEGARHPNHVHPMMMECSECGHRWLIDIYPDPSPEDFLFDESNEISQEDLEAAARFYDDYLSPTPAGTSPE